MRRRYELALRPASLESARAGGIFRRRAGTKVPSGSAMGSVLNGDLGQAGPDVDPAHQAGVLGGAWATACTNVSTAARS